MVYPVIRVLIGGMVNLIGQVGGEIITSSASIIRKILRESFGEDAEKYVDIISIVLSIIITILIIIYLYGLMKSKS